MPVGFKSILTLGVGRKISMRIWERTVTAPVISRKLTDVPSKGCHFGRCLSVNNACVLRGIGPLMTGTTTISVSTHLHLFTCRTYAKKGKDKGGKPHKKVELTSDQLEGLLDLDKVRGEFEHVVEDLKDKFIHQITVRTSKGAFDSLLVKTPDGRFPLIQLGQVLQKSPQLLSINLASSPQYIANVKEALAESGLNINPQQEGTSLFVPLPKVTREHRENLAKNAKMLSEKSKKHLREMYSKESRKIKSSKSGHSSDDLIAADDMVQDLMHGKMKLIDEMTSAKQKELLGGK